MSDKSRVGTSKEEQELMDKVTRLVDSRYKSDWRRAFDSYAGATSTVDRDRLIDLLEDAGIGNWATRGVWADGILAKMDRNGDKRISWGEFEALLRR